LLEFEVVFQKLPLLPIKYTLYVIPIKKYYSPLFLAFEVWWVVNCNGVSIRVVTVCVGVVL
jgi:hypothetical protein